MCNRYCKVKFWLFDIKTKDVDYRGHTLCSQATLRVPYLAPFCAPHSLCAPVIVPWDITEVDPEADELVMLTSATGDEVVLRFVLAC
jgi:hypothetical protein